MGQLERLAGGVHEVVNGLPPWTQAVPVESSAGDIDRVARRTAEEVDVPATNRCAQNAVCASRVYGIVAK